MQPLINLKQFLAVLVLLIVPAALLTAYFRNFQPESGNNQRTGASGHHAMAGMPPTGGEGQAKLSDGQQQPQTSGQMDHSKMGGNADPQVSKPAPNGSQLEASRAQLEASRLQLEASRKALEAAGAEPQSNIAPPQGTVKEDGNVHQH